MWSRLTRAGLDELLGFLLPREEGCVGFTGRILKRGKARLPNPLSGGIFVERDRGIGSAVLLGEYGVIYPIFGPRKEAKKDAKLVTYISSRCPNPSTVLGKPEDLEYLCELLEIAPAYCNEYFTMTIGTEEEAKALKAPFPGLKLRKARPPDLERLYPLQEAYELEEVITPLHKFNPAAAMLNLQKSLRSMTIMICEFEGEIIAKAGTNAHGFAYDQIGGVYVMNAYRGRGLGSYLSSRLVFELLGKGRKASLFVKKQNAPALAAYRKVGFRMLDSFRIGYFV